ncbi:cysteine-rich KTR domain-containing protein [Brevibacillus ruminantium]
MAEISWILCPICKNKTRLKVREDTILENFPLFCPKCKQETLINVQQLNSILCTKIVGFRIDTSCLQTYQKSSVSFFPLNSP